MTYYSKAALYDSFKAWRDGGPACSGRFDGRGAWKAKLTTHTTRYDQGGKLLVGVERVFDTKVFDGNLWGLQWSASNLSGKGVFPQYYRWDGDNRVAVPEAEVPDETRLRRQQFKLAGPGVAYASPGSSAWAGRGQARPTDRQAGRRLAGYLPLVPLRRSAVVPTIRLERGEKGKAASLRRKTPRKLADGSRLHGPADARRVGFARSRLAGDAAQGHGEGLRPHCDARGKRLLRAGTAEKG